MAVVARQKITSAGRERIDIRLRSEDKSSIERAAQIRGLTVTDFIVQNALESARHTIREQQTWKLEREDAEFFVKALLRPPTPGVRLRAAAKRYRNRYLQS